MMVNFSSKIAFSILRLLEAFSGTNSHVIIHHGLLKTPEVDPWRHVLPRREEETLRLEGCKQDLQCLSKAMIPLKLFHNLSCYNHKIQWTFLGLYVIDQCKQSWRWKKKDPYFEKVKSKNPGMLCMKPWPQWYPWKKLNRDRVHLFLFESQYTLSCSVKHQRFDWEHWWTGSTMTTKDHSREIREDMGRFDGVFIRQYLYSNPQPIPHLQHHQDKEP